MACVPIRYWICLTILFIGIVSILNRLNVNIAIVSMVNEEANETEHPNICPALSLKFDDEDREVIDPSTEKSVDDLPETANEEDDYERTGPRYEWSPELQGIVLGSFFWTYFICQTPSGYIAGRYGGYVPICISLLVSGIISIAIPFVIPLSVYAFISLRIILGIFQSAIFPGLFVLLCSWFPLHERSTAIAVNDIGPNAGNLIILFSSGFIINALTWKAMFWLPGALSLLAFACVVLFLRNKPEDHSLVSKDELDHIRGRDVTKGSRRGSRKGSESGGRVNELEESMNNRVTREPIPWLKIFSNKAVWAFLIFKFCRAFTGYLLSSEMPTYLKTVLHEDVVTIGIVSSIHTSLHIIAVITGARVSEILIVRGFFSRTNGRKTFSLLSGLLSAVFLALIPIFRCNLHAVRAIYIAGGLFTGCGTPTDSSLPAEMSTKFHGILFALGNLFANIPGFLAPMMSGAVLEAVPNRWVAWDIIFFSVAGMLMCANVVFLIFASAKRQDFDLTPSERRESRRLSSLK